MTQDPTLEGSLGALGRDDRAGLAAARAALAARAAEEDLLDVAYEQHDSPLGALLVAASPLGVVRVGLPSEGHDDLLQDLAERISPRVMRAPRAVVSRARAQLDDYFAGRLRDFDLPLDWRLTTGFRRAVLHATARIPYGVTASYAEMAAEAGSPRAVRAAGTALATNPLPLVVPCHRVIRSDGSLGRYGGGVDAKALLLGLEGAR